MGSRATLLLGSSAALAVTALLIAAPGPAAQAGTNKRTPKPEIVELGRRLFMDPTVSRLGKNSCASCHDPERAFGDSRRVSPDDAGATRRHSQTLVDLTGDGYHWDGEFQTVRQLLVARVAPADMANEQARDLVASRFQAAMQAGARPVRAGEPAPVPGTRSGPPAGTGYGVVTPSETPLTPVAERLAEDGRYAEAFKAAFGVATPTTDRILDAMDAYCASIRTTSNAFDRFLAGDDAALSPAAIRGLALFEGKAKCATCHVTRADGKRAPFTDGKFHDTGVAYRGDARWREGLVGDPAKDPGRGAVSFLAAETATFKTPTLRDVALRAPYMHDGSFATLTDVVLYYAQGGTKNPNLDTAIRPIDFTDGEVTDLVAFLESLTGTTRAGLGFPLRHAAPLKVRVEDLNGAPMDCLTLKVAAAGDRLAGAETVNAPGATFTDAKGVAVIERPLATHVVLTNPGYDLGLSRPIPDTCESQTLIATPRDTISLRVRRTPDAPQLPAEITVFPTDRGISMGTCGPQAVAKLKRIRMLGAGEAIYAAEARAGGETRRCTLLLDGTTLVLAEIRLGGGASETIRLERPSAASSARQPPAPPLPGQEPPSDPGEGADHGTERDSGPRDVGDRR